MYLYLKKYNIYVSIFLHSKSNEKLIYREFF